jgi:hypothetical protein
MVYIPIYSATSVDQSARGSRMDGAVELATVFFVNAEVNFHDAAAEPNKSRRVFPTICTCVVRPRSGQGIVVGASRRTNSFVTIE